ncbi:uncharacterized protein L203_103726 [Cryptococcus depauperatus CBS 7841]|uniref:Cytochrome c oxidase assembly factor 3 n=1 Tax=Cryptococcus depauperatus CBS 7841 TaxID=1295531 RepID=A0A1E3IGY6_9TREE|nr:mitochondrial protein [Cryptococcus depauperatus CBS 7841]
MSSSLKRARKPFILTNALIGGTIVAFAAGVYAYSISAVQQDDFSDVADLLPPLEERSNIKSIEDEAREKQLSLGSALSTSNGLPRSSAIPNRPIETTTADGPGGWRIKRLGDIEWIRTKGLVDPQGNVLVWGAPNVDDIGRMGDEVHTRFV